MTTGLTPAQTERLMRLRRRRTQVTSDIEILRKCENRMSEIRARTQHDTSEFRKSSRQNSAEWRGQNNEWYGNHRNEIKSNSQTCLNQMTDTIKNVSQGQSRLSAELSSINSSIRELERQARGGV